MLGHLKLVVQTTDTLKISEENLIVRQLCTVVNILVVTPGVTNIRGISKKMFLVSYLISYLPVYEFLNRMMYIWTKQLTIKNWFCQYVHSP